MRSVMLRALWTWQRWISVWRPKVLRMALDSALAPSTTNRRPTAGSRPRATRLSSRACTTAVFSCPFNRAQWVLVAHPVNANRAHQHQIVVYAVSYTHLRAHETRHDLVCRLL